MPAAIPKNAAYYEVLGLQPDATEDSIRMAYKKLALKWHPDRHQENKDEAQSKFVEIQDAYLKVLEERQKHRKYKTRKAKSTAPSAPSTTGASFAPSKATSECSSADSCRDAPIVEEVKEVKEKKERHPTKKSCRPPDPSPPPSPKQASSKLHKTKPQRISSRSSKSEDHQDEDSSSDEELYAKKPRPTHPHKTHSPLDDTDYEFVDLSDVVTPLRPLRSPKSKDKDKDSTSQDKEWVFPLLLSLEDIYQGASQHYRITRTRRSGTTQSVKVDVQVSPNWHSGTRIRVPGVGNERKDGSYQDIVFLVEVEPHPTFTREGDDLVVAVQVPWADPHTRPYPSTDSTACPSEDEEEVYLKMLDGQEHALPIPRSLVEAADGTRVKGAGMPIRKHGKNVGRGDLIVKWEFIFPDEEKESSRASWQTFKRAMHWKT
ncbi:DnaJ-domain-containing protein [Trametopsis cervina]|nr:DnaJ-domain-containing protein [Trametopsis cervina]